MPHGNPFLGGIRVPAGGGEPEATMEPVRGLDLEADGTERFVALFMLGALGVLVLFRFAGFQAVIAGKVGVGK